MSDKDKQDAPEFFVSRRGRHVGIHEVDLKGIDIDNDNERDKKLTSSEATASSRTAAKPERVRTRHRLPRKKLGLFAAIVGVLVLLPLLAAEIVAAQYRSGVTNAKTDLGKLVSTEVLPAQKKTAITADQLRTVAGKVNDIVGRMCRGGMLDNAAPLYPRAKAAFDDCKGVQRTYAALTTQVYALESQARYLEKLGVLLKPVTTPITDDYAVIGAQQTAWLAAADGIKDLSPPERMTSAHTDLAAHLRAIADAWSKLNAANDEQDATAFMEAEKILSAEYEAVRGSSVQLLGVLSDTQATLTAAYNVAK